MNYTAQGHTTIRRARKGDKGDKGDPGIGITAADVVFCVADSQTEAPADNAAWQTLFKQLALSEGKYVWQATKITYTTAVIAMTGKQCLGQCEDFAAVIELYALGDSPTEYPESGWATTYAAAKGKWLWTRSRIVWTDKTFTLTTPSCIGYMGEDGDPGNGIAAMRSLFALTDRKDIAAYADISSWQTDFPQPTEQTPYVWLTIETTYTSGDIGHSTPTLAAQWQAGANPNLLDNAAFVSDDRIGAWTVRSTYNAVSGQTPPSTDTHGTSNSQRVQGRNSYADMNSATAAVANYKDVLQQSVHDPSASPKTDKLTAAQWHTLSFWAKRASDPVLMSGKTFTDGGLITDMAASVKLQLIAGQNIAIAATGYINSQASKLNATLRLRLALGSTEIAHDDIDIVGGGTIIVNGKAAINAAITTTGEYTLTAMLYKPTATSGTAASTATLSKLTITDDHDLTTYLYSSAIGSATSATSVIDGNTKPIIDGKEYATALGDLGVNWKLSTEWTRHTVTFKTAQSLPTTSAAHVLFRLMPAMATAAARRVWICQPKLETGMLATAFIDTADDAKGDKGDQGVQGMVYRVSEWSLNVYYRNDTDNPDGDTEHGGIRYIDIVTVTNTDGKVIGCYRCKKGHMSESANKPRDMEEEQEMWQKFNTMQPIYTPLLVAENAVMRFTQTNRLVITDTTGTTIQGCLQGVPSASDTPLWIGGKTAQEANFQVAYDGTLTATNANVSGTVRASNFYHNVLVYYEDIYGQNTGNCYYYVTENNNTDYPHLLVGHYYTEEEMGGGTSADDIEYMCCTGPADIILLRDESFNEPDKYTRHVVLPKAEDFAGKVIEVIDLNRYGATNARPIVLTSFYFGEVTDNEYDNTIIKHIYSGWTTGAKEYPMTIGTRLRLLSVNVPTSSIIGGVTVTVNHYYWLIIDESKNESLT